MIDQIHGMILKKTPNYAVLETGGVGLKVLSTINTLEAMPAKGKKTFRPLEFYFEVALVAFNYVD